MARALTSHDTSGLDLFRDQAIKWAIQRMTCESENIHFQLGQGLSTCKDLQFSGQLSKGGVVLIVGLYLWQFHSLGSDDISKHEKYVSTSQSDSCDYMRAS